VVEGPLHPRRPVRAPSSWAVKTKPRCFAKATISGAITAFLPVPRTTTTLALSSMQRAAAPSKKRTASVRKTFTQKRFQVGNTIAKSIRE